MRIVRVSRWPRPPFWAMAVVVGYLGLVGLSVLISHVRHQNVMLCHVHRLTGYPCPTCGTTRMVMAALAGDPGAAFLYNPFMATVLIAALALLLYRVLFKRKIVWITKRGDAARWAIVFVVALLANWCYVLIYHGALRS